MKTMRSSFVEWLCNYAVSAGPVRLAEGMLAILALASGLSALFGATAIRAGAVIALMVGNVGLIAVLTADHLSRHEKAELDRELLRHYCTVLLRGLGYAWQVHRWSEIIVIRKNGDARVTILVTATVECDDLHFFKIYHGARWVQPARYRRRINPSVRTLEVNGVGGARQRVTTNWDSYGVMQIIAHFREPLQRGSEISMIVEMDWPGMCLPLIRHAEADEFVFTPTYAMDKLEYVIVLPSGLEVCHELLGLVHGVDDFHTSREIGNSGKVEVRLVARNLAAGKRVGLVLDRTENGARVWRAPNPTS